MRVEGSRSGQPVAVAGMQMPMAPLLGAVDCHCHVFEPDRHPYVAERSYTPGSAIPAQLQAFHSALGVDRAVLVQPSVYGHDNRCLLDGLAVLGRYKARGIAVIDPTTVTEGELGALCNAGVVGVRVNLEVKGEGRAAAAMAAVSAAMSRVAPFGLVLQIYVDLSLVETLAETIASSPVPVVLDHFGGVQARHGVDQAGLRTLEGLLASGRVHVKLSAPYRASDEGPDYGDLEPIARMLVRSNPERVIWASDWPHTGGGRNRATRGAQDVEPFRSVDDARNLALLSVWCGDPDTYRKVMVDNAAKLFRF